MDTLEELKQLGTQVKDRKTAQERACIAAADVDGENELTALIDSHILELWSIEKKLNQVIAYMQYVEDPHQK